MNYETKGKTSQTHQLLIRLQILTFTPWSTRKTFVWFLATNLNSCLVGDSGTWAASGCHFPDQCTSHCIGESSLFHFLNACYGLLCLHSGRPSAGKQPQLPVVPISCHKPCPIHRQGRLPAGLHLRSPHKRAEYFVKVRRSVSTFGTIQQRIRVKLSVSVSETQSRAVLLPQDLGIPSKF